MGLFQMGSWDSFMSNSDQGQFLQRNDEIVE